MTRTAIAFEHGLRVTFAPPRTRAVLRASGMRFTFAPPRRRFRVVPVAGPPGAPGRDGTSTGVAVPAGEPMTRLHVAVVAPDGRAYLADPDDVATALQVVGVTASSVLAGEQVDLVQVGDLDADTLPLGPLYLGPGGSLTADSEASGLMLHVGLAVPGRLIVHIQRPIHRA